MKEINLFYEHCRQNHLLFHALEKGTGSDTPLGLPPPLASLQPPPVSLICTRGWRVTANEEGAATSFLSARKKEKCCDFCAAPGCGRHGRIILSQPAYVPLGEPLHTGSSVQHGEESTFLHCQDVVRIKKYIKDSWMVSYYGNVATWLRIGALRPYLPCLHSTLHIRAPEICPLACAQLWKDQLRRLSLSPSIYFLFPCDFAMRPKMGYESWGHGRCRAQDSSLDIFHLKVKWDLQPAWATLLGDLGVHQGWDHS